MRAIDRPAGVKLQAPVLSAVVVPSVVPPSLIVPPSGRPAPLIAGFDVTLSVDRGCRCPRQRHAHHRRRLVEREAQRCRAGIAGEIGLGCGQRVRAIGEMAGVKLQAPVLPAVGVPSVVVPSLIVTSVSA